MRLQRTFLFAAVLSVCAASFTSCKTVQVAKFASVESVMNLKLNSTFEEVVATLGFKPYDVLSNQIEGYSIFTYKYKLVERQVNPKLVNSRGGETTGTEVYNGKEHTAYLFFKGGKLESFVTTDGRKDSPALVMLNNTLYSISRDREKYIIVPTSTEQESSGVPALPMLKKRKK